MDFSFCKLENDQKSMNLLLCKLKTQNYGDNVLQTKKMKTHAFVFGKLQQAKKQIFVFIFCKL